MFCDFEEDGETYYGWYSHDGNNYPLWFYDGEYDDIRYGTRWYYREPIYTYYFYQDNDLETTEGDPTGQDNVSNVVEFIVNDIVIVAIIIELNN